MNGKIAQLGMFGAIAIIFGYVETMFPISIGVPGVKIGFANLITVFLIYAYSWKEAFLISSVRILVIGFMFGNLFSIVYSFAGTILSLVAMMGIRRLGFGWLGVSMIGGVTHNIGQILIAMAVLQSMDLLYYLPVLMISGLAAGILIGIGSKQVYIRVSPLLKS